MASRYDYKSRSYVSRRKWIASDRPRDSQHLDGERVGARVMPARGVGESGWEWSIWIGPPEARVIHNRDTCPTQAKAKRAAEKYIKKME